VAEERKVLSVSVITLLVVVGRWETGKASSFPPGHEQIQKENNDRNTSDGGVFVERRSDWSAMRSGCGVRRYDDPDVERCARNLQCAWVGQEFEGLEL
jgi:hypothetical protein